MYNDHLEQFTLTLADVLKSIKRIKDKRMSAYGLRSSHVMVLYILGRSSEGLTPAELAEASSVDKALISRIVAELIEKGFIVTLSNAAGKRYKLRLRLTPAGEEVSTYIATTVSDIQREVSGEIPAEDLEIFYRTLFTLQANFHKLVEEEENCPNHKENPVS